MKKKTKFILKLFSLLFTFILLFSLVSCDGITPSNPDEPDPVNPDGPVNPDNPIEDVIDYSKAIVKANQNKISIKDKLVLDFDYKSLFTITVDGEAVEIKDEFMDLSEVNPEEDDFLVTCVCNKSIAYVTVTVIKTEYKVTLSLDSIEVSFLECLNYDYLKFFKIYDDDVEKEITLDMITSNIQAVIGTYQYTVTYHNSSKTLIVNVESDHVIDIRNSYNHVDLTINELEYFDFKTLFNVYVDEKNYKIEDEYLTHLPINEMVEGNSYEITISITVGETSKQKVATINIVAEPVITITHKDLLLYVNHPYVDLTELFTVFVGSEKVYVSESDLTGTVDYTTEGEYLITCNYENVSDTAVVTVRRGVVVTAVKDDIYIKLGTDKATYNFAKDFEVVINGIEFNDVENSYVDTTTVDFNTEGVYTASMNLTYTDSTGTNTYSASVNYHVLKATYDIQIKNDNVVINPQDEFNPFSNVTVYINNIRQTLTRNPNYVDRITCFVDIIQGDIDTSIAYPQEIIMDVYVYGIEQEPVRISYNVTVESKIQITSTSSYIFEGGSINPTDYFEIIENNENVLVTLDMIEGYINPFVAGEYDLTLTYKGVQSSCSVVVITKEIAGTYVTSLTQYQTSDDIEDGVDAQTLAPMVITSDGGIKLWNTEIKITSAIFSNMFKCTFRGYEYTCMYQDDIIVLIPENTYKLKYHQYNRPLVYFKTDKYQMYGHLIINSTDSYVSNLTYQGYSIDCFRVIVDENTDSYEWYGLKTEIVERSGSDYYYDNTFAKITFDSETTFASGTTGKMEFAGENYEFDFITQSNAKISSSVAHEKKYANMTFTGVIDGYNSSLVFNEYEGLSIFVNGDEIARYSSYEFSNLKYGGIDYDNDIVYVYSCGKNADTNSSFKLRLDTSNNTFTMDEHDHYYGYYVANNMYLFLDGYSKGLISFNTGSYYVTPFDYEIVNGELVCTYFNTSVTFDHGDHAIFYTSNLGNILKVKYLLNASNVTEFIIDRIQTGAIVNLSSFSLEATSPIQGKRVLSESIEILVKDSTGENAYVALTTAEKQAVCDFSKIDFRTKGFYEFTITIEVYGEMIVSTYALHII